MDHPLGLDGPTVILTSLTTEVQLDQTCYTNGGLQQSLQGFRVVLCTQLVIQDSTRYAQNGSVRPRIDGPSTLLHRDRWTCLGVDFLKWSTHLLTQTQMTAGTHLFNCKYSFVHLRVPANSLASTCTSVLPILTLSTLYSHTLMFVYMYAGVGGFIEPHHNELTSTF